MAKHLIIVGRVQGVGYRAAFERVAQSLAVRGWVRNRRDGSVEALVEGEAGALDQIVTWAKRGPPAAEVVEITVNDIPDGALIGTGFTVRATE